MARATTTIVLFRIETKTIIAEVFEGEQYFIPSDVTVYNGTLEDFLIEYPDYEFETEIIEEKG